MTAIEKIDPACQDSLQACLLLWLENPYRLVSLKDLGMEHGYRIYKLLTTIHMFEVLGGATFSDKAAGLLHYAGSASINGFFERPEFKNLLEECAEICADLNLHVSFKQLDRLSKSIHEPSLYSVAEFGDQMKHISSVVSDELETCCFVWVSPEKQRFYKGGVDPLELIVSVAFPSAAYDISEANKCYALGRNTACVLHLMRVLEKGLAVLAGRFNVEFRHENWENVIGLIEKQIKALKNPPIKMTPEDKDDAEFYAQCAFFLRSMKEAWRNHAIHGRGIYNEQQALDMIGGVRAFMLQLATKLTEHGAVTP